MKRPHSLIALLLTGLLVLAACQKAGPPPTVTPDAARFETAAALFARPTRAAHASPTPEPAPDIELAISRTLARMEQAVLAGDRDGYLANVWTGNTTLYVEQFRWAQDWVEHPLSVFDLSISALDAPAGATEARARLTITWTQRDQDSSGGATLSVVFIRDGERWLYGGEDWQVIELDGIRLYYFANSLTDNRAEAETLAGDLPDIHARLTALFGFKPAEVLKIRLYESAATLQTVTRLSQARLTTWNRPGEAIKLTLGPSNTAPRPPDVAREVARWLLYCLDAKAQRSGGEETLIPWWLVEGFAEYGAMQFRPVSQQNRMIGRIAALAAVPQPAGQRLFAWDELADRDTFAAAQPALGPPQAFELARDQSATLVYFIGEQFGIQARRQWLEAVSNGQWLDEATEDHLGQSFAALDEAWRAWLAEQEM